MLPQSIVDIQNTDITPYGEIRGSLRTGDLVLCAGKTIKSRFIRVATKSPYSHVAVVVRMISIDRVLLLESEWPHGVRAVPMSQYLENWKCRGMPYPGHLIIARHDQLQSVEDESFKLLLSELVNILGQPYNIRRLFRIGIRRLIALLGTRFNELQIKRATICSEYVYRVYSHLGIKLSLNRNGYILPTDIAAQQQMSLLCRLR